MKHWIYIGLVIILLTIIGIGYYNYNKLENQFQEYRIQQDEYIKQIDSLSQVNKENIYVIDSITLNITKLQKDIECISKDKRELESKLNDFVIKNNLDSNIIILRQNIWKYSH